MKQVVSHIYHPYYNYLVIYLKNLKITYKIYKKGSDTWIMTDDKNNIILLTLQIISLLVNTSNPNIHINQVLFAIFLIFDK